jgi:predicted XRE-type DNA-binding protein
MTKAKKKLAVVRGSGNVFADFGHPNAAAEQIKTRLAAEIIRVMNARELTARQAEALTGIEASDFSRIRNVKLDRFTIDRLITVLEGLDQKLRVSVTVKPRGRALVAVAL